MWYDHNWSMPDFIFVWCHQPIKNLLRFKILKNVPCMKLLLTAQGQSRFDKPRMLSVGFKVF